MKDQGSIKIQQLFQETKDLNERLFGQPAAKKNNYFHVNEMSVSSKSSNQDYSPVRRPHSRSRSRGAATSQSRGQAAHRSGSRSAKSDKDAEGLNWPQQMKTQTDTNQMTGNFEDMNHLDHDERLYSQINLANSATGGQNQWQQPQRDMFDNPGGQEEIDQCHDQIARQASQIHQLQIQVENLTMQLDTMRERYKGIHNESSSAQQSLHARLQHMTVALQSAQNQLLQKESSVTSQSRVIEELKGKIGRLDTDLAKK